MLLLTIKKEPWFYGNQVGEVLEYINANEAIFTHVDIRDVKKFAELKKFIIEIPKNAQPTTIYINRSGLYSLVLSSKMPKAREFKYWVTSKVLPSVDTYGFYILREKYTEKLDKLKKLTRQVKVLRKNQKKNVYSKKGVMYILRPSSEPNKKFKKLGFSNKFNSRLNTYNTSVPDDMEILFMVEVNDPESVEKCVKNIMIPYIYRDRKEFYEASTKKIKDVILQCNKCIQGELMCNKCNACSNKMNRINFMEEHMLDTHEEDIENGTNYVVMVANEDQYGGNFIKEDYAYIKTKLKNCDDALCRFRFDVTNEELYYDKINMILSGELKKNK